MGGGVQKTFKDLGGVRKISKNFGGGRTKNFLKFWREGLRTIFSTIVNMFCDKVAQILHFEAFQIKQI